MPVESNVNVKALHFSPSEIKFTYLNESLVGIDNFIVLSCSDLDTTGFMYDGGTPDFRARLIVLYLKAHPNTVLSIVKKELGLTDKFMVCGNED